MRDRGVTVRSASPDLPQGLQSTTSTLSLSLSLFFIPSLSTYMFNTLFYVHAYVVCAVSVCMWVCGLYRMFPNSTCLRMRLGVITKQSLLQADNQPSEADLSSSSSSSSFPLTSLPSSISPPQRVSPDHRPPCRLIDETRALLSKIKSELAAFNRRFLSVVEHLDTEMEEREKQQRRRKMKKSEEKDDGLPPIQGLDIYIRPPRSTSSLVRDRQ